MRLCWTKLNNPLSANILDFSYLFCLVVFDCSFPWLKKIIWVIGVLRQPVRKPSLESSDSESDSDSWLWRWLPHRRWLHHPDDLFQSRYATPGFKPFSYLLFFSFACLFSNQRFLFASSRLPFTISLYQHSLLPSVYVSLRASNSSHFSKK